jgi:putative transposase
MDETILSLHPPLRACWMRRGQQKRVSTPGTQKRLHLFGAYHFGVDTLCWTTAKRKNSQAFIEFLEQLLLVCHPHKRIILVLDNASIHKSAASMAALSLFEHRMQVVFLPTYCSFLNPIERFWRHLKDHVCVNKLYPALDQLTRSVEQQLQNQNDLSRSDRFSLLRFKS